jgi:hypothetical protein
MKPIVYIIAAIAFVLYTRLWGLLTVPPSLYWEEVALGYDAYSILHTGMDHHGNRFPIIAFESFGDWKPSLYFYYLVPFVWLFGLSDLAVRSGAVAVGIASALLIGVLARQLKLPAWLAIALVGLSPWAIQFSRAAWEVHLATLLLLAGLIGGVHTLKTGKGAWLVFSAAAFGFSMYAYHAARVIAPLSFELVLGLYLFQDSSARSPVKLLRNGLQKLAKIPSLWAAMAVMALFLVPLLLPALSGDQAVVSRFQSTSIFSDISIIEESNSLKDMSGNSLAARLLYHRYVLFGREILANIFSYTTLDYLVLRGDENLRHSTGFSGILNHIDILFLAAGLYVWIRNMNRYRALALAFVCISLIPASISTANPHALRTLSMYPVILLLIAQGIVAVYRRLKLALNSYARLDQPSAQRVAAGLLVVVYMANFMLFWRYYTKVYPVQAASEWQYGYAQLVSHLPTDRPVAVSRSYGRPAMYYWFYSQTPPAEVQSWEAQAKKEQSEFTSFKNIAFFSDVRSVALEGGTLIAGPPHEIEPLLAEYPDIFEDRKVEVRDKTGKVVWTLIGIREQ